jgi:hypothetical protein
VKASSARLAVVALLAAACSSGAPNVGARFNAPAAVVPFVGQLAKHPQPAHYLAVASSGGDELIVIDPSDDQPVLGPGGVFPLSIPTDPRPLLLAAAQLGDRGPEDEPAKADLLVAVSAGSLVLQVVNTWQQGANRVEPAASVPLDGVLGADAQILSLAALTMPGGSPRARVLVGATGGSLAVVDFERDPKDDVAIVPVPGATARVDVGFDAVDLAVEPNGARAFAATPDPIGGASGPHGIAQFDASAAATDMAGTIKPLDAKAPTLAVAAESVRERTSTSADQFEDAALRVYAALDPRVCGPGGPIACGIATLVPSDGTNPGGLAPDPAAGQAGSTPAMPFRAPIPVPGTPVKIAVALPPASGSARTAIGGVPAMNVAAVGGTITTTAVAAVTSSDGRVYVLDVARFAPVNDTVQAGSATPTSVTQAVATVPSAALASGLTTEIALANDTPLTVTPGFTGTNDWAITWQGPLPQLASRTGIVVTQGGVAHVAVQTFKGGDAKDAASWVVGAEAAAPELGVHVGDIVQLACTNGADEAAVADFVEKGTAAATAGPVAFPGGALKLAAPPTACVPAEGQTLSVTVTVRAAGLVLTRGTGGNPRLEHLGRPKIGEVFSFQWQSEDVPPGASRDVREALALARAARRVFYPRETLATGPVVAFKVGLLDTTTGTPASDTSKLARDAQVTFSTQSGLSSMFRRPQAGGGVLPRGMAVVDKTLFGKARFPGHENDAIRIYTVYTDNEVISFSPAETSVGVRSIR